MKNNREPEITLNNGVRIPQLGFGLYKITEEFTEKPQKVIEDALECGYRRFDTASFYGNEKILTRALAATGIKRENIFIATKLSFLIFGSDALTANFEESIRALETDYIDLYLIHWPIKDQVVESYAKIVEYYNQGRVRAIGVSNYLPRHLDILVETCDVIPAVNQIELHPRHARKEIRSYCKAKGIAVEGWSPLSRCASDILESETITQIARKYQKTPAQTVLRWHIDSGFLTVPKTLHKDRMLENRDIFDFYLEEKEIAAIDNLNRDTSVGRGPLDADYREEELQGLVLKPIG